jgi:hypothetical protein
MKSLRPLFPAWRMVESFPAIVWAVGWLAVFKGILWIFIDPNFPASIENAVFMKELLLTVPFVVFGGGGLAPEPLGRVGPAGHDGRRNPGDPCHSGCGLFHGP